MGWSRLAPPAVAGAGSWLFALVALGAPEPLRFAADAERVVANAVVQGGDGEPTMASGPSTTGPPEPVDPELARLLEKAGEYVVEYEQRFRNVVAEEEYVQWVDVFRGRSVDLGNVGVAGPGAAVEQLPSARGRRRVTRADLVFVQLGDESLWTTFRDVFEVDGKAVRDRDARLERLFLEPARSGISRAREIMNESAAYNIGPVVRTINVPTLPLVFLHPKNQKRFLFARKGRHKIEGVSGVEVRFEETGRPTFVKREADADLSAEGSFWIDPARGTVLRTRIRFEFPLTRSTATVTTEYHPEPRLAMWLPSEMRERYEGSGGTARYSNFRRFGVSVEEKARLPDPGGP